MVKGIVKQQLIRSTYRTENEAKAASVGILALGAFPIAELVVFCEMCYK